MLVKTHLIVTEQSDNYKVNWVKRIIETNPEFDDSGNLIFTIVVDNKRITVKTLDMVYLVERAKKNTYPRGRGSVTTDKALIYIKEKGDKDTLIAIVNHTHLRKYAPMYDEL